MVLLDKQLFVFSELLDYLGADCSVHRGTSPTIDEVQYNGLCDKCQGFKVTAKVIISGVVCRYREVKVRVYL